MMKELPLTEILLMSERLIALLENGKDRTDPEVVECYLRLESSMIDLKKFVPNGR